MERCICGLDHSEPLPDSFEGIIPIVLCGMPGGTVSICHVCGRQWKGEKEKHYKNCKYLKWKRSKKTIEFEPKDWILTEEERIN